MITDKNPIPAEAACRRKDSRRFFEQHQSPIATCITVGGSFRDRVKDLSSKGVFLATDRSLSVGEEIAMTITFPGSQTLIRATGDIIRADTLGVGVEFKVVFNY
jgi:PilZ domain